MHAQVLAGEGARVNRGAEAYVFLMGNRLDEMTDEMAVHHWLKIANDAEKLMDLPAPAVQPGSDLAGDDGQSNPYQVSHCAQGFMNTGIDHLHAVTKLILKAQVLHPNSDYTLIRGPLENVWLCCTVRSQCS